jgi:sugar-specific transcriptional regulator TrmB
VESKRSRTFTRLRFLQQKLSFQPPKAVCSSREPSTARSKDGSRSGLSREKVLDLLESLGLTEPSAHIYIFLSKKGPQRALDIARSLKLPRQTLYRAIKSLESKGIITATLEHPAKFSAIPFDKVLDLFVKAKAEEVHRIKQGKKGFLMDWKAIAVSEVGDQSPRFTVIEGRNYVYPRLKQMIEETKQQLSIILTVSGLVRAEQSGLIDAALRHASKTKSKFRFLTEGSTENLQAMRVLLERIPTKSTLEGRIPALGQRLPPRMVIRDDVEAAFFINQEPIKGGTEADDICLWTNCKALVESFRTIFENLWTDSIEIETKIVELETGRPATESKVLIDKEAACKKYEEILHSAKREIVIVTSAAGIFEHQEKIPILKEGAQRGVSIRIMAPITTGNLRAAQSLSRYGSIRHVPPNWQEIAVVDSASLFQFNNRLFEEEKLDSQRIFENAFCTNDRDYTEKVKNMLNDLWSSAQTLAALTPSKGKDRDPRIPKNPWGKTSGITITEEEQGPTTEKALLNKIIGALKVPLSSAQGEITLFGSLGMAVIRPPDYFNLPEMRISAWHIDKQSSLGSEDMLTVDLWLETALGFAYVPVATIGDNPQAAELRRVNLSCSPAGQNSQLVTSDELYVRVHGNTMFAGWAVPIKLLPKPYVLPPACILFEGFGPLKTGVFKQKSSWSPKPRAQSFEFNGFEAFVTFTHPISKYSGPGTEGLLFRDLAALFSPHEGE